MPVDTILPSWALILLAAGVGTGVGGLGIWVAAQALEKLVRLIRRTLAAEMRLQHLRKEYDLAALNYWIRDAFRQKELAAEERCRANQEKQMREQIAKGADAMLERNGQNANCA